MIKSLSVIILCTFSFFAMAIVVYAQLQTDSNPVRTKVGNPVDAPPLGTAPAPPSDIRQGIIDNFGITMNGFDNVHLEWAWERFWEVSGTNFNGLVRGSIVEANSGGLSAQVGCPGSLTLRLGQYTPKEFFKFILLHEFGHVIQACHPVTVNGRNEQINAFATEGGVSYYANNAIACVGAGVTGQNEDYADMIAYYIDRSAGFSSGPGGGRCGPANPPNPYEGGGFPLHLNVAGIVISNAANF